MAIAKKATKEGAKEKRANMRKKANEEAMLKKRAKEEALKNEALEFYRQLKERNLPHFDGASIDFHRKRDPVVFVPRENPVLSAVRKEELLDFLRANDIRRVLVDALFPSRVPLLQSLLEHGIEVYVLRRPTALSGFKAMLERGYNKKKQDGNNNNNGIKIPRKNDFVDAVALAFTWPKFHRKIDIPYLICWRAMNRWRRSYMLYYKVQQMLSEDEDESPVVTLHEDRLIEKARRFVDTVERHFPGIRRVFEKVRIPPDDVISQALCCEVVLEVYHIPKKSDVLEKAGIRYSPTPKKPRPKKKEGAESESKEDEPKPKYIHDGKLLFALTQLAVKLYHLNPKRQKRKVMWKAAKLAEKIWKCSRKLQVTEESGRVGEALGVSGPLEKRGLVDYEPRFAGALLPQGNAYRTGTFQGPKHPADRSPPRPRPNPPLFTP
jgi:hypothetical protein